MAGRPRDRVTFSLEGGEADPQYERRADADLWVLTCKRLRNMRLVNGGGAKRRPGLARVLPLSGATRLMPVTMRDGATRMLGFRSANVDVFKTNETIEATIGGAPWGSGDIGTMQFATYNDYVVVASRSFFPQKLTWNGAAFALANFPFLANFDGSSNQPYYRFSPTRSITLQPSATSGAGITITASAAVFVAGHVGCRFRILGREFTVTAFTDSTHVTATAVQTFFPTRKLTVASSVGFAVGDQCRTSVNAIECEVCSIVDGTHVEVILIDTFTDPATASNTLIGPNATSAISAVAAPAANGATVQWDEQMISSVRGYPGGCTMHKQRLVFYDFPAAPEIHALSVIAEPDDFDVGKALDDDAIIDGPGDALGRRVRWVVSTEQMLTLTEVGGYYVGEGPNTPITPTTVEFLRVGTEPAGACNPILATEGVIFAETDGDRLMLYAPSGQLRRVWGATEMLAMASELLTTPSRLLLVDGCEWGPERYILAINSDGTLCVAHYRRDSEIVGAMLWTSTNGIFSDVAKFNNKVYAVVNRAGSYSLERFDEDRLLDNSVLITNGAGAIPTDASWAARTIALVWRTTAGGENRRVDIGLYLATAGALTAAPTAARAYEGGDRFDTLITLWSPIDPAAGAKQWMRVSAYTVDLLRGGQYYVGQQRFTAYRAGDDLTQPPPLRTGWRRSRALGRAKDFDFSISQIEAAPLQIRSVTMEVH